MSMDCDCYAKAEDPCMKNIGILASTDPVSLEQACINLVYNSRNKKIRTYKNRLGVLI